MIYIGYVSAYYDPASEYWLDFVGAVVAPTKEAAIAQFKGVADKTIAERLSYRSVGASVEVGINVAALGEVSPGEIKDLLETRDTRINYSVYR